MRNFLISIFAVLIYCLSCGLGVYGFDCSNQEAIKQQIQNECLSQLNLPHHNSSSGQIDLVQNAVASNLDEICRDQMSFKAAMSCVMKVSMSCLAMGGVRSDILPEFSKMVQGIRYLCDNKHDIDAECYKESQVDIQQCTLQEAMSAFTGDTTLDIKSIVCKSFEIGIKCQQKILNRCSGRTSEILNIYMQNYLIPLACQAENTTEGGYRFTTMAPLTAAQLVTSVPVLPDVSCYSQTSIQEGQLQCFTREGITIQLPNINVQGSLQTNKQSILDSVMHSNENLHHTCGNLPRYQRAMACAMEVAIQCLPADYRSNMPSSRNVSLMLKELCQNINDTNQDCINSMASALFDCGYEKAMESQTSDVKQLLCRSFSFTMACQLEVLPPCGCRTVQVYTKLSKDYMNPPACPPIQYRVPECDSADTTQFSADTTPLSADTTQFSADTTQFSADTTQFSADTTPLSADTIQFSADTTQFSFGVAVPSSVGLIVTLALLASLLQSLH